MVLQCLISNYIRANREEKYAYAVRGGGRSPKSLKCAYVIVYDWNQISVSGTETKVQFRYWYRSQILFSETETSYFNFKKKISCFPTSLEGKHITDTYITETDTTELENLIHNIIDIFIIETYHNWLLTLLILKIIHICHKWYWHIWSLE